MRIIKTSTAYHLMGWMDDNKLVAYTRLLPPGWLIEMPLLAGWLLPHQQEEVVSEEY